MSKRKNSPQKSDSSQPTLTQNNINIYQTVVKDLHGLPKDVQDRVLTMVEKATDANIESNKRIITLEEANLQNQTNEIPYIRKYSFRGQALAFVTVFGSLASAIAFGYFGMELAAIASISVLGGTVAVNFIKGKESKN